MFEIITIEDIVGIGLVLLQGYFFYNIISCLLKPRKNLLLKFAGWVSSLTVASIIIYPQDTINITYCAILFLFMTWFAFEGKWHIRISVVMLFYPIVIAINFMMGEIFGKGISRFFPQSSAANTILYNLSFAVPALFWFLYWRRVRKRLREIRELLDEKAWMLLDIICFASMMAVYCCVYYTPEDSYKVIPCMAACMITNMGSIRIASYLADSILGEMERKNLRMQQKYYEELEKNQLQIRKFRHDMKHHFAAVGELMREGEFDKAKEYFEEFSEYMEVRNRQFCKNGIVNALLNVKYNLAQESQIDCFFHISIDEMMGIDDISLCTIFANTLDNAIESCRKMEKAEDRKLSVKARYTENGYFSYEIVNSKRNKIYEKKGVYLTDKEDKKSHGLGISSVREIVDKYGGMMDISYTDDEFRVVILIEV